MHFSKQALAALIGSATSASAAILWDGRFDSSTMAELKAWSWSNQVGDYQNYIVSSLCFESQWECQVVEIGPDQKN